MRSLNLLLRTLPLTVLLVGCSGSPIPDNHGPEPFPPHVHETSAPPNVVLIVLDTARADRFSSAGYRHVTSPYLDAFARDAVTYGAAHSVAPWTLPSHMSMFTGLLPGQHGATWKAFAEPEEADLPDVLKRELELASPERMLPARMQALGYRTAGFSSNAWIARRTGFQHGFDTFVEIWQERDRLKKNWDALRESVKTSGELDRGDAGQVLTRLKEFTLDSGGLEEPFFLFFNFIDPHYPYSPPPQWRYAWSDDRELGTRIARFKFSELEMVAGGRPVDVARFSPFYDAEISYMDAVVGRLLALLERMEFYDESLIVITSDHGELLGEGGGFSHQFSMQEELLRVPLWVKFPGNRGAGSRMDDPRVSNLDVYRTILEAAGDAPDPTSPSRSLDPDTGGFDREFLLAEDYWAMPFLKAHLEAHDGFDLESQQVVRRVLFDGEQRHAFVERPGEDPAALPEGENAMPGREAAAKLLNDYVRLLGSGMMQETGREVDEDTMERLRSLGYVQAR